MAKRKKSEIEKPSNCKIKDCCFEMLENYKDKLGRLDCGCKNGFNNLNSKLFSIDYILYKISFDEKKIEEVKRYSKS